MFFFLFCVFLFCFFVVVLFVFVFCVFVLFCFLLGFFFGGGQGTGRVLMIVLIKFYDCTSTVAFCQIPSLSSHVFVGLAG